MNKTSSITFLILIWTIKVVIAQQPIKDFTNKPVVKWKFKIERPILSSPVVNDGLIYFGGLDSTFYVLDLGTGKIKWKHKTNGAIRANALIDGNVLYLNAGNGSLYAMDRKSGKIHWTFLTNGEKLYDFADYHHSTPVLKNGVLYFGSGDGNLYAVRADTGTKVWNFQTGDVIHGTPSVDNGKVFFGSFDGNVYAVDIEQGTLAWKFKTIGQRYFPKGEVQGSPAVYKDVVVIGARDFNVYAISQKLGTGLWNRYLPNGWGLVNTIKDSVLYIGTGDERKFIAIDPRTGREYWKKDMELLVFGSNAYSQSMLYVGTTMGKLHGFDLKTGEEKWTFETDGYLANRLKFFKEDDSYRSDIYDIIKTNEQFLETQYLLGGIFSTPAITDDNIIISTTEGVVYCLKR